jgi:hypothetical protein
MADASPSLLATLAPVVVGGVIALAGGWFGPWLLERRKEKAEKKKRRSEKFEEMVGAVYEFDHWVETERQIRVIGKEGLIQGVSPFAKVRATSAVYFPQFENLIRELENATGGYRAWMTTAALRRVSGISEEPPAGFVEAVRPYTQARDNLLDALRKFAQSEFQ